MAKKNEKKSEPTVVLVRTYAAGVHVGEITARNGKEITLANAHRVWRWRGANTLHELSQRGGDTGYTRVSEAVPSIDLLDAIEVIPCSEKAAANLRTPRWP
jgi:hypothetical protein